MAGGAGATVTIRRRSVFAFLLFADGMFILLHLLTRVLTLNGETLVRSHDFVNLDAEVSFPTWWQQSQLVAAAVLCLLLGAICREAADRQHAYWRALGGIFIFISIDEGSQLHEGLIDTMHSAFDLSAGIFTFAWVIPGAVAVLIFGAVFIRFWYRLPPWPRMLMAIGGALFVLGALGFEMVSGEYKTRYGIDRGYSVVIAIEEGLEMVGASFFIFSALSMLKLNQPANGLPLEVVD